MTGMQEQTLHYTGYVPPLKVPCICSPPKPGPRRWAATSLALLRAKYSRYNPNWIHSRLPRSRERLPRQQFREPMLGRSLRLPWTWPKSVPRPASVPMSPDQCRYSSMPKELWEENNPLVGRRNKLIPAKWCRQWRIVCRFLVGCFRPTDP